MKSTGLLKSLTVLLVVTLLTISMVVAQPPKGGGLADRNKVGKTCTTGANCTDATKEYCEVDVNSGRGQCKQRMADGASCSSSAVCLSNICKKEQGVPGGTCAAKLKAKGEECGKPEECKSASCSPVSKKCRDGQKGQGVACTENEECQNGFSCDPINRFCFKKASEQNQGGEQGFPKILSRLEGALEYVQGGY